MTSREYLYVILAFLLAGVCAFAATPLAKRFAIRVGAVDKPGGRHIHIQPTPLMGGLAIFFGFVVSMLAFTSVDRAMTSILLGAVLIVAVSAFDDIFDLSPWLRLGVHIAAACLVVFYGGVRISVLSTFGLGVDADLVLHEWFSTIVTLIWIVGVTNAVNWIDGLDGLAAGISGIAAISLLVISVIIGDAYIAIIIAGLAGAIIGFLPYNLHPAKIFMGDTGAMFLGFILATLSIQGLFKFYVVVSFIVPVLVLGLPIIDMCITVLRRVCHGKSPMESDRSHMHHQLIDLGFSQRQSVAILYFISGLLGVSAVIMTVSSRAKGILFLIAIIIAVVFAIYVLPKHIKKSASDAENSEEPKPR